MKTTPAMRNYLARELIKPEIKGALLKRGVSASTISIYMNHPDSYMYWQDKTANAIVEVLPMITSRDLCNLGHQNEETEMMASVPPPKETPATKPDTLGILQQIGDLTGDLSEEDQKHVIYMYCIWKGININV